MIYTGNRTDDTYVFSRFSRNINKRYAENQKFLNARYEWTVKAERRKSRFCTEEAVQVLQVPYVQAGRSGCQEGHGKICIHLSEVPGAVRETQLVHRIIEVTSHMDLPDFPSAAL